MYGSQIEQKLACLADLTAGVRVKESFGRGPWFDVTERTKRRLHDELVWLKDRIEYELELYRSGEVSFRFADDQRVDTTPEIIASLEADLALLRPC